VRKLKNTEALGHDAIPVSVFKKCIISLAAPIAHVVNQSLASGTVPDGFKSAQIHPLYKGGGKSRTAPASNYPVAILPVVSKILEVVVKQALDRHLKTNNILSALQHGFCKGRSCTTALVPAHRKRARATSDRSKVIGVMAFDLSAAFDTVCKSRLRPKLWAVGIRGKALEWFEFYLRGGEQSVVSGNTISDTLKILYGLRQGSILGPRLYLVLVADLPSALRMEDRDGTNSGSVVTGNTGYADNTGTWAIEDSLADVTAELQHLEEAFSNYTRKNGLALNGRKTQLFIGYSYKVKKEDLTKLEVVVDRAVLNPSDTLELLGFSFDRKLTVRL
jgi:hypothetical protein